MNVTFARNKPKDVYVFNSFLYSVLRTLTQVVVAEEEDEQEVGCVATEEGVRRRRWEKWDLGLTGVTKCGLFYS